MCAHEDSLTQGDTKMKNETKLKKLAAWLDENGFEYMVRSAEDAKKRARSNLFIPKFCVSVKIEGKDAARYFKTHRSRNPVFIRDEDTPKFVIEKVQNTITKSMLNLQKNYMRRQTKSKSK